MVRKAIITTYLYVLRALARAELRKNKNATIIGVTGSSGKTSCKDIVVAFLAPHAKNALKFTKKGNSETGIPYEILDIPVKHYKVWEYPFILFRGLLHVVFTRKHFDIFVIEYGIDSPHSPRNMDYLLSIVKPHIAVLLSVSSVHAQHFDVLVPADVPKAKRIQAVETFIAREKFKLLQAIPDKKNAFITKQAAAYLSPADYAGMTILNTLEFPPAPTFNNTDEGVTISFEIRGKAIEATLKDMALPSSAIHNFHFAAAVTQVLAVDLKTSMKMLPETFHLAPGRSSLLPGNKNTIILDSSYNASPFAAKELFPLVKDLARAKKRHKIIVLGDLRELGDNVPAIYADVIREAAKYADDLILTNDNMREYGIPAAEHAGMVLNENLFWFANGKQLSFHINEMVEPGAVVLFEGSQNTVYLEYAVKELCANKDVEYIRTHIPRMSGDWLEVK